MKTKKSSKFFEMREVLLFRNITVSILLTQVGKHIDNTRHVSLSSFPQQGPDWHFGEPSCGGDNAIPAKCSAVLTTPGSYEAFVS